MASPVENSAKQLPDDLANEPSMEEILASIKQIIADDEDGSVAKAERENFTHPDNPSNSNVDGADGASNAASGSESADQDPLGTAFEYTEMQAALEAEMKTAVAPSGSEAVSEPTGAMGDGDALASVQPTGSFESHTATSTPQTIGDRAAQVRAEVTSAGRGMTTDERLAKYRARGRLQMEALATELPAASSSPIPQTSAQPGVAAAASAGPILPTTNAVAHEMAATMMKEKADEIHTLLAEMMRPTIRQWLSDNLPSLVEKLVREEIESVSKGRKAG